MALLITIHLWTSSKNWTRCQGAVLPIVLGGDFNLIRSTKYKSTGVGDKHLMNAFNDFIGEVDLRELYRRALVSPGPTNNKYQSKVI